MNKLLPLLCYQIRSDMHQRYLGSLLGAYWSVVNPLLQVGLYVFLFSIIFQMRLGGSSTPFEYALFCLAGLGAWLSFQEALTACVGSISRNAAIVKNVAFPAELFPISSVVCSCITLCTTYSMLLVLHGLQGHFPGASILALPLVVLAQGLLAFGLGLFLAVAGAFFRDLSQILPILLQLWMLATPVLYQRSDVPARLQFLTGWNPLYHLIDAYRQILYYGAWPDWAGLAFVALLGLVFALVGWKLFRFAEGYFEAVV